MGEERWLGLVHTEQSEDEEVPYDEAEAGTI